MTQTKAQHGNSKLTAMASLEDWSDDGTEEEECCFSTCMHTEWAKIEDVSYTASAPDAPRLVTARIVKIGDEEEEKPVKNRVSIVYKTNNGDESIIYMQNNSGEIWEAYIPAQSEGARVDFYVRVDDNFGNVTTGAFPSSVSKINYSPGMPDMDNSIEIVPDDMDLIDMDAGYDGEYIYVRSSVQGKISGGTIDPPYIHLYGIKFTNPDIEATEGLMVGKLWVYCPLIKQPEGKVLITKLLDLAGEKAKRLFQNELNKFIESGMVVLDIGKLMGGNISEGIIFQAQPEGTESGNVFTGRIRREIFNDNPSGYIRIMMLTSANAATDSFMPIPLNNSHYLTLQLKSYSYTAP